MSEESESAAKELALLLEERAILRLLHRYAHAMDYGDESAWVDVFTADGVFDLMHGAVISNPGVPHWWPAFCGTYDVAAAAYLAWLIISRRTLPRGSAACRSSGAGGS